MLLKLQMFLAIILLNSIMYIHAYAASEITLENKVKAAYLYNFTRFVQWPQQESKKIKICILGDEMIGTLLKDLVNKRSGDVVFDVITNPEHDITNCHILYLSNSINNIREWLLRVKEYDVLTVSDADEFAKEGGIVGLFTENGKLRFEINMQRVGETNLQLSSKLLGLAKLVK